jgi:hypothetical protein
MVVLTTGLPPEANPSSMAARSWLKKFSPFDCSVRQGPVPGHFGETYQFLRIVNDDISFHIIRRATTRDGPIRLLRALCNLHGHPPLPRRLVDTEYHRHRAEIIATTAEGLGAAPATTGKVGKFIGESIIRRQPGRIRLDR